MLRNQKDDSLAVVDQLNQRDANGYTPLTKAIYDAYWRHSRTAAEQALALINNPKVDLSATDKHGKTAFYYANLYSNRILIEAIKDRYKRDCPMPFWGGLWHTPYTPSKEQIPSANFEEQSDSNFDL